MEKYDIKKFENYSNKKEREFAEDFHKKRIAFLIVDGKLLLLKNQKLSHFEWARSIGVSEEEFNNLTRGYVLDGKIVFYKGNFDFDEQVVKDAEDFAEVIKAECGLSFAGVYAGVVISEGGGIYPPKKHLFDL